MVVSIILFVDNPKKNVSCNSYKFIIHGSDLYRNFTIMTKDNYQSDFLCSFAVPDRNLLKKV